jgi:transposase
MDVSPCEGCRVLSARIAELEARLQEQARLILDLARKLQDKDLPKSGAPAQQPESSKPPAKKPSPRKPGGQPGHPPHMKMLLPPERVCQ